MAEIILLVVLITSICFFLYEFHRMRYFYQRKRRNTFIPTLSPIQTPSFKEGIENSRVKMRQDDLEKKISNLQKRLEKQEEVISKLIEKLSEA